MIDPEIEVPSEFKRRQKRARINFFCVVMAVLAGTIAILGYVSHRFHTAERDAATAKKDLDSLAAQARLRSDLRTERKLDRAAILQDIRGERQKKVIGIVIDLYNKEPPIPYAWGGKSPVSGFNSSGYVAYVLGQADVLILDKPETYLFYNLREKLKKVPVGQEEPGDVLFYESGACMFYLGGEDNLSIGMLPGGMATGKLDQNPIEIGRY
jgi:cell wall-associated NlpC family hydrolase